MVQNNREHVMLFRSFWSIDCDLHILEMNNQHRTQDLQLLKENVMTAARSR
jgi:hypothetical protein